MADAWVVTDPVTGEKRRYLQTDPTAKKYVVYRAHDEAGNILYIGVTSDIVRRLKGHYYTLTRDLPEKRQSWWLLDARRVSMVGPYTWREALRVERAEIEHHQPPHNRAFTKKHGWQPQGKLRPIRPRPTDSPRAADAPTPHQPAE